EILEGEGPRDRIPPLGRAPARELLESSFCSDFLWTAHGILRAWFDTRCALLTMTNSVKLPTSAILSSSEGAKDASSELQSRHLRKLDQRLRLARDLDGGHAELSGGFAVNAEVIEIDARLRRHLQQLAHHLIDARVGLPQPRL